MNQSTNQPARNGITDRAMHASETVTQAAARAGEQAQEMGRQISERCNTTIREYPLPTVLTFFGLGVGVGLLLGVKMADAAVQSYRPSYARQWSDYGRDLMHSAWSHVPGAGNK